jgi:hypothetical protein
MLIEILGHNIRFGTGVCSQYWLDGLDFESQLEIFAPPNTFTPILEPTLPPLQWVPGLLISRVGGGG